MIQKMMFSLAVVLFLFACGSDVPSSKNAQAVGEKEWKTTESGKPADELAANAVPDSDVLAKVKFALTPVQEEYKKAENVVPGVGKVTILVDANLSLIIKNEKDGKVTETVADLKSLDPETTHLGVIVDQNPGEFPGIRIPVLAGKTKVMTVVNGSVKSKDDHLEIILADRQSIQRIASAMMNAIQVAHGQI